MEDTQIFQTETEENESSETPQDTTASFHFVPEKIIDFCITQVSFQLIPVARTSFPGHFCECGHGSLRPLSYFVLGEAREGKCAVVW